DGKGQSFSYAFDVLNRQSRADYPAAGLDGELLSIVNVYDENNNPTRITESYRGGAERITENRYDIFDRLESVIDGSGKELRYTFDANGNRDSVRDADKLITRYTFDALNRISAVQGVAGSTTYSYDR